nr:immunoglobulin heavy chain junction region [Macaca mulatta]MPN70451.1 immunoglobulin heavy chain junction region [Macaca mulatta]MPN70560.1 immunoglobulin heavy chain junction region [Macaca mulatta]MPN70606.1 immunoglobulin heavy chain junction region [Macaca mulatta]MPN70611.1 immunoglobulin heavy chain junction region [Macaca mulatta]
CAAGVRGYSAAYWGHYGLHSW